MRWRLALPVLAGAALALAGCGGKEEPAAKLKVATAFAPLQELATQLGGPNVVASDLTPLGGQPHDLVPSAPALAALKAAKVVFFLGDTFQPAVAEAVSKLPGTTTKLDLASDGTLPAAKRVPGTRGPIEGASQTRGADPHVWLDPERFVAMAQKAQTALIAADAGGRASYESRGGKYVAELTDLATDYKLQLASCKRDVILTTHPAWGYLAERYGFQQAVAAGIVPGAALDPRSLDALAGYADAHDVSTLFTTTALPTRQARTIKQATGLEVKSLNPIEGLTQAQRDAGAGYVSLMRENLATLTSALECAPTVGTSPSTPAGSTPTTPPVTSPDQ